MFQHIFEKIILRKAAIFYMAARRRPLTLYVVASDCTFLIILNLYFFSIIAVYKLFVLFLHTIPLYWGIKYIVCLKKANFTLLIVLILFFNYLNFIKFLKPM